MISVYLGRKRLSGANEPFVKGSQSVVHVDYSYWTLCYALTLAGARKLLDAQPLSKMVPVDEYLPIMFDKHPEATWTAHFPNRDLKAFSVYPLLVYPTHYTGEENYISDTEDSVVVDALAAEEAKDDLSKAAPLPPVVTNKDEL
ncbi:GLT25D1 protein, putative [Ixodes scapularis]|uniref:GLT25D1 protein, putative n=1 Tax=Ixodes scapularis TaxID=6945 RepID=B7QAK2_IXOSC|nr:GLT25D1 protein, putative [Ixodes scapularis]|eukprot:XP_002412578.1 GLT25D1 protein, putative [Ixodes scapularis]